MAIFKLKNFNFGSLLSWIGSEWAKFLLQQLEWLREMFLLKL